MQNRSDDPLENAEGVDHEYRKKSGDSTDGNKIPHGWRRSDIIDFVAIIVLTPISLFCIGLLADIIRYEDVSHDVRGGYSIFVLCCLFIILGGILSPVFVWYSTRPNRGMYKSGFVMSDSSAIELIETALHRNDIPHTVFRVDSTLRDQMLLQHTRKYAAIFEIRSDAVSIGSVSIRTESIKTESFRAVSIRIRKQIGAKTFIEVGPTGRKTRSQVLDVINFVEETVNRNEIPRSGVRHERSFQSQYWHQPVPNRAEYLVCLVVSFLVTPFVMLIMPSLIEFIVQRFFDTSGNYFLFTEAICCFSYLSVFLFFSLSLRRYNRLYRTNTVKRRFVLHAHHIDAIIAYLDDRGLRYSRDKDTVRMPFLFPVWYQYVFEIEPGVFLRFGERKKWGSFVEIGAPDGNLALRDELWTVINRIMEAEEQPMAGSENYVPWSYRT